MVKVPSFSISGPHLTKAVCFDQRQGVLALQEALGLFVLKTAGRPGSLRGSRFLLCDPLAQLAAGGERVGGEDDQATLGVVHVCGGLAAAVPTLRQWIPGYPRCAEPFLQRGGKNVSEKKSTFNI